MQMTSHLAVPGIMRDLEDPLHRLIMGRRTMLVRDRMKVCLWKLDGAVPYAEFDSSTYELTQEVDNWSEYVEPGWKNDGSYLFSFVHPQPPDEAMPDFHVFETPRHNTWDYMLVDLQLPHQNLRTAVAYEAPDTVLDIFRIIARGRVRLQSLLSTSLVLRWEAPEGPQIFYATQRPQIPAGAYVTMRIGELPHRSHCQVSDEKPMNGQPRDGSSKEANASNEAETEEASYMQRPSDSYDVRSIEDDATGSDPSAVSFTDDPSHALSSDGGLPATMPRPGTSLLDDIGRVKSFLADYERALPPDKDELLLQLLLENCGSTRVCAAYCPRVFLQESAPFWRFQQWCCDNAFPLEEQSNLCPVQTELYQNMPALIIVRFLARGLVPMVVQVVSPNPNTPAFFLVFLANAREMAARLIGRVQAQIQLPPFELRYNGRRVRWFDELQMMLGGVLRLRIYDTLELQDPSLSTEDTGPAVTLQSHNTWSSIEMENDFIGHTTLPLGPDLRPVWTDGGEILPADDDEEEPTSLLQAKYYLVVRRCGGKSLLSLDTPKLRKWSKEPVEGLPPPGNPTQWTNRHMDRLDDYFRWGGVDFVVDFPFVQLQCSDASIAAPRTIRLSDHIPQASESNVVLPISTEIELQMPSSPMPLPVLNAPKPIRAFMKKQKISLDAALAPRFDLPDFTTFLGQVCSPLDLGAFPEEEVLRLLPDGVAHVYDELRGKAVPPLSQVEIYTDGSYSPEVSTKAGWSFVVIVEGSNGWKLFDFGHGQVADDPLEPGWVGCSDQSARSGEGTAIIRAIEWVIRHSLDMPHTFCFDAQTVGYGISGFFGFDRSDAFMIAGRSMAKSLEVLLAHPITWKYVPAHSDIVGNEVADALAKIATKKAPAEYEFPDYVPLLGGDRYPIEQLWLALSPCGETLNTPLVEGRQVVLTTHDQMTGIQGRIVPALMPSAQTRETDPRPVKRVWKCVTYNVSSLQPRKSAFFATYLREQIAKSDYAVSFLQETRSRESQLVTSQSHFRITAAADRGRGGVEIWLLRRFQNGASTGFAKEAIQVLYADPQFLLTKAVCKGTDYLFFTFHAPHSGVEEGEQQRFWALLRHELMHWVPIYPNFIGGFDANAHMSYATLPHIGQHGLEERTNFAGTSLGNLLAQLGSWLPSTFEACHAGPTKTWISNVNGQGARCDYFMLPEEWNGPCRTFPDDELDSGTAGIDHSPLACEIEVYLTKHKGSKVRCNFDRQRLQQCAPETLAALFSKPPIVPWSVDVHQHATILAEWVAGKLATAFPSDRHRPRKTYITETTWRIRQARLALRKLVALHCQKACNATTTLAFHAWRFAECLRPRDLLLYTLRQTDMLIRCRRQTAQLTKDLQRSLKRDRTLALEQLGEQANSMSQADFAAALRSMGVQSRRKPTFAIPLPMVRDEEGCLLDTTSKVAERWRTHFSLQEDGQAKSIQELMDLCDEKKNVSFVCPEWSQLPTFIEVEASFRRMKSNKAYYCDDIPGDLLARIPAVQAGSVPARITPS